MRSLNKARTSSASLNVKRLRLAVIAIARLTFANMAADSGVLLGIILAPSSFAIHYFPPSAVERTFGASRPRRDSLDIAAWNPPICNLAVLRNSRYLKQADFQYQSDTFL